MAELTCSVNTCASHNGGYCCRNSIKIDGHSAVMKDQTFCGSFQQKTGGAVNAACGSTPSHCAHNQCGHCSAENVTVSGGSVTEMTETICDSFEAR